MGCQICIGEGPEIVVKGQRIQIPACLLRQVALESEPPIFNEERELLYATLAAETEHGVFSWRVSFNCDEGVHDVELVSVPADVEVVKDPEFVLVEVEHSEE